MKKINQYIDILLFLFISLFPGTNSSVAADQIKLPSTIKTETGEMILIPKGKFIMGSNERHADEGPQYEAYLDDYYIDRYELSNAEYKKFVDAAQKRPPFHWKKGKISAGTENHPVVFVNWYEARDFCSWAKKRLPNQEEWEKASRGTDGRRYPWGDMFDPNKSNNPQKGSKGTEPVDSYKNGLSPYGVYNMSGNVWEWTIDWYKQYKNNTVANKSYGEKNKVLKGGSWYDCVTYGCGISAPVYNRSYFIPRIRNNSFGFRCVKDVS